MLAVTFPAGISNPPLGMSRRCCWSTRRPGSVDLFLNGSCTDGGTAGRFRLIVLFVCSRNSLHALLSLATLSADRALKVRFYLGWRLPSSLRNTKRAAAYELTC